MRASHNNAAGRVGYVRAVFSERARGFAAPVDLLRVVLRVANRIATRQRIGDAFRGYLVSESGQVAPMFAKSREKYRGAACFSVTGPRGAWEGRKREFLPWADEADFCLDAPEWLPGGGARRFEYGMQGFFVGAVLSARGGK